MSMDSENTLPPLGQAIRELRGVWRNQQQFADEVGVSRVTVSIWESGGAISLPYLQSLVGLGLSPAYLLEPQAPANPTAGSEDAVA